MIPKRKLAHFQREIVALCPMAVHIAPGIIAHARRTTDGRLHISARKPHALFCQPIHMGGVQMRMALTTQIVKPELIKHDEKDVLFLHHKILLNVFLAIRPKHPHHGDERDHKQGQSNWIIDDGKRIAIQQHKALRKGDLKSATKEKRDDEDHR